jgi:hypothetical protein
VLRVIEAALLAVTAVSAYLAVRDARESKLREGFAARMSESAARTRAEPLVLAAVEANAESRKPRALLSELLPDVVPAIGSVA